jgi:hypothetical protein
MRWIWGWGVVLVVLACGGEGDIGEPCDERGKTDGECKSGAVCGTDTGGALRCLKICAEQANCLADQECNGVEGTNLKACRIKSSTTNPDGG